MCWLIVIIFYNCNCIFHIQPFKVNVYVIFLFKLYVITNPQSLKGHKSYNREVSPIIVKINQYVCVFNFNSIILCFWRSILYITLDTEIAMHKFLYTQFQTNIVFFTPQ